MKITKKNMFISLPFVVMEKCKKIVLRSSSLLLRCSLGKRILKEGLGFSLPFIWCVSFRFLSWVLVLEIVPSCVCVCPALWVLVFGLGGFDVYMGVCGVGV